MSLKPKAMVLSTVLVLTLAGAGSTAGGTTPARWIVFSGLTRNHQREKIFRVRADGTDLEPITTGRFDIEPAFAPNGKRVIFTRRSGIFVVNLDGSGLRRLTRSRGDESPVYSPDGRRIAFVHGGRLYVMRADGSGRHYLLRAPWPTGRPSWTPDGKSIALPAGEDPDNDFLSFVDARTGRIERRRALELDLAPEYTAATLSPNGRLIAFIGRRPEPPGCQQNECEVFALYLERASHGWSQHVIDDGFSPGWSSDSRTLVYFYRGDLRLQPLLHGRATKTIELDISGFGEGPPALQPG